MNGKERAAIRKIGNTLTPIVQIGKGDVTDAVLKTIEEALKKRELIKLAVLETATVTAREAADAIASALSADVIQCIGRKIVLYRYNPDNKIHAME